MMPSIYQRKRTQDAMRRQQQEDEHIRKLEKRIEELEEENERLRYALQKIKRLPPMDEIHAIAADAIVGGGPDNA